MTSPNILSLLSQLAKVDSQLLQAKSERLKRTKALDLLKAALQRADEEEKFALSERDKRKQRYQREDKELQEERDKLTERRKSLGNLGDFKIQQAGQREIDHANRQLSLREEALVAMLDEAEVAEKKVKEIGERISKMNAELADILKDFSEVSVALEETEKRLQQERLELSKSVDRASLQLYDKVKERHGNDPLSEIDSGHCKACQMQVVPQLMVEVLKGESLVRCRGCGRLLVAQKTEDKDTKGKAA